MQQHEPSPPGDGTGGDRLSPVPLKTIYWIFFQIGALSVGGGLMAWLYREIVEKRKLMTESDFMGALTLAQVLPGINVANLSIYVGQRLAGAPGAVTAMLGLISLPFFAILGFGALYPFIRAVPALQDLLAGLAAAAVALLLAMGIKAMQVSRIRRSLLVIVGIVVLAVGVLKWPMIPVILVLAPASIALSWPRGDDGEAEDA